MEEIVLDDTEKCQQHTYLIRNLLDDIISNALGNSEKSSDAIEITNEMSAIAQQFTPDDTLIRNDVLTPIMENHRTSISVSSTDES